MFQFTREFIINNSNGKLKAGTGSAYTIFPSGATSGKYAVKDDVLYIDNLVNINKKDIVAAYKNPGIPAQAEELEYTPSAGSPAPGDVFRLVITLSQVGRVISTYNNCYPTPTKDVIVEMVADASTSSIDDVVTALVDNFNSVSKRLEGYYESLSLTDGTGAINIIASDEFTRVANIKFSVIAAANPSLEQIIDNISAKDFGSTSNPVQVTKVGYVGQGTTNVLIRNHRLPTTANFDPYGADLDERPVPGGIYTQYTLELVTERRQIGHQVVGALDRSLTTMVFYVLESSSCDDDATTAFEDAFGEIGIDFKDLEGPTAPAYLATDPQYATVDEETGEVTIDPDAKAAPTVDAEAVSEQNALVTDGETGNAAGGSDGGAGGGGAAGGEGNNG